MEAQYYTLHEKAILLTNRERHKEVCILRKSRYNFGYDTISFGFKRTPLRDRWPLRQPSP